MGRYRLGMRMGAAVLGAGRWLRPLLPPAVRRGMEDRVFGAIFQVTRVTNDHYGWRPESKAAPEPKNG